MGNISVKILVIKEIVSRAQESANKNAFVEGRWQNGCVQVRHGSAMLSVEKLFLVGTTPVSRFATLDHADSALVQGIDCVHVEKQGTPCPAQKMSLRAVTAVTRFWSAGCTSVLSDAIEALVKHADRRLRGSVAVASIQNKCPVISLTYVKPNAPRPETARGTSAGESVVQETARPVISNVDVPWDVGITSARPCATEEAAIHVLRRLMLNAIVGRPYLLFLVAENGAPSLPVVRSCAVAHLHATTRSGNTTDATLVLAHPVDRFVRQRYRSVVTGALCLAMMRLLLNRKACLSLPVLGSSLVSQLISRQHCHVLPAMSPYLWSALANMRLVPYNVMLLDLSLAKDHVDVYCLVEITRVQENAIKSLKIMATNKSVVQSALCVKKDAQNLDHQGAPISAIYHVTLGTAQNAFR